MYECIDICISIMLYVVYTESDIVTTYLLQIFAPCLVLQTEIECSVHLLTFLVTGLCNVAICGDKLMTYDEHCDIQQ